MMVSLTWCSTEHFRRMTGVRRVITCGQIMKESRICFRGNMELMEVFTEGAFSRPFILGMLFQQYTTEMVCRSRKPVRSMMELYGRGQWEFEVLSQLICTWGIQSQICCSGIYTTWWLIGYVGQIEDGLSKAWGDYETFAKMEGTE